MKITTLPFKDGLKVIEDAKDLGHLQVDLTFVTETNFLSLKGAYILGYIETKPGIELILIKEQLDQEK